MTMWALVKDGNVLEIRSEGPNVDQTLLAPGKPRLLPLVDEPPVFNAKYQRTGTLEAYVENNQVVRRYNIVTISLEDRKAELLQVVAMKRRRVETSGFTLNGMRIPTDRETQSIVTSICAAFDAGDITGTVDFKLDSGFVSLDSDAIHAVRAAGAQHVQAAFSREAQLSAAIEAAADHAALDLIDIIPGWSD